MMVILIFCENEENLIANDIANYVLKKKLLYPRNYNQINKMFFLW